jgi:hypothetical protein
MNDEGIYNCTFCGQEMVVPIDVSAEVKQEFVDDCPQCSHSNVIHVKFESTGYSQVWVRRDSHDKHKNLASHVSDNLNFTGIDVWWDDIPARPTTLTTSLRSGISRS